jgi:2-oxoglutarate ferredoxin oxidoreductase subunit alpha
VQEAYDLTIKAFDLAFKYRNPVMVLADAIIGQMKEPVVPWEPANRDPEEGQSWGLQGAKGRSPRLIKSLFLDDGALAGQNLHLQAKYEAMQAETDQEMFLTEDADLIVVAFGSIGRITKSTIRKLRAQGHKVGLVRPITLFPFPSDVLLDLARQGKRFLTIEHNMGQMVEDVRLAIRTVADSAFHAQLPGNLPTPDDFEEPILKALEG